MKRIDILQAASNAVLKNRQEQYGPPENSFGLIALFWQPYLDAIAHRDGDLKPHDVAALQILMKIARIAIVPSHPDNWVDIAGYAACGGELAPEPAQKEMQLEQTDVLAGGQMEVTPKDLEKAARIATRLSGVTLKSFTPHVLQLISKGLNQDLSISYFELSSLIEIATAHNISTQ